MNAAAAPVFARVEGPNGIVDYQFHCPGCGFSHSVRVEGMPSPWKFNGDVVRPTVTPSILVRWDFGEKREPKVCHSFVTDGQIRFLNDCTHKLAGQTTPLEPV